MKIFNDLNYSTDSNQNLDFLLPENKENYDTVLISLHGGSWSMGDKSDYSKQTEEFAKRLNVPTVNMNYRMSPSLIDEMTEDVELAMNFIIKYAKQFGCEFKKCILRGFSAGAHIAMSYAYRKKNESPLKISFLIGESAPSDLAAPLGGPAQAFICRGLTNIVGKKVTRNNWAEHVPEMEKLSPINYITPDSVPTLLLHGTEDYMVGYKTALKTLSVLQANNVPCELVTFEGARHQCEEHTPEMVEEYFSKVNSFFLRFSKTQK